MKIYNQTKDKLIADQAKSPKNFLESSIGLIGAKKAFPLILKTSFGIHTFGVPFPIDVLVLDQEKKVVGVKESMRPFSFFVWNPKYNVVIELPEGAIKKTKTSIGDKLTIDA
jgi:hypothetical protein